MDDSFLGRGWKFPIRLDAATGRIQFSAGEEDIAEAIRIILMTAPGERVMRPDFGCGIHRYVFEVTDPTTLRRMEAEVRDAIIRWEPRVYEVEVRVNPDRTEVGLLQIHVSYEVRATNNLYNHVYPFYLHEGAK